MHASATRKLWARRAYRAGWFISPIISAPVAVVKFIFNEIIVSPIESFFVGLALFVISAFIFAVVDANHDRQPATKEDFMEYMSLNQCTKILIPERVKKSLKPFSIRDLKEASHDCDLAYKSANQKRSVQEAIIQIGK